MKNPNSMPPLILDTNVLVAGLRSKRGASYQLIRCFDRRQFGLKISVAVALEYEDVLKRPGLLPGFNEQGAIIVTHNKKDFAGAVRFGIDVRTPSEILKALENRS